MNRSLPIPANLPPDVAELAQRPAPVPPAVAAAGEPTVDPVVRFGRAATARGAAALALVVLVVLGGGVLLFTESGLQMSLAADVNEAGRQRMLTQRIAAAAALGDTDRVWESAEWLHRVHDGLMFESKLPFAEVVDEALHVELMRFIATARAAGAGDPRALEDLPSAAEDLLPDVDRAVDRYEAVVAHRTKRLRIIVLAGALATVVAAALAWIGVARPGMRLLRSSAAGKAALARLGHIALTTDDLRAVTSEAERLIARSLPVGDDEVEVSFVPTGLRPAGWDSAPQSLCIPIGVHGTIVITDASALGPADLEVLHGTAGILRAVSDRSAARSALEYRATHDPLTSLPNRTVLLERIADACASVTAERERVALLFVDLDGFKDVNDAHGHRTGDHVLRVVAERLRQAVRPNDTVARLGGDEFVILAPGISSAPEAAALATRTQATLARPIHVDGLQLLATASIGVAFGCFDTGPEQLLRDANIAMHTAKQAGRNRVELFDAQLRGRARQRLDVATTLAQALEEGRLAVHYQPIVDVSSGEIVGVESLARLRDGDGGWIPPNVFIPVAEENGLIERLGAQVLERACREAAGWVARSNGFMLSVNVSPRQLGSDTLVRSVEDVLDRTELDPHRLVLEVTESIRVFGSSARRTLRQLRELGAMVAIDDFGTGYSSLAALQSLPVDMLKIDRSFVAALDTDENGSAAVTAIMQLASSYGLTPIAEGVETEPQRCELDRLGCQLGQGYLWSRPSPADQIATQLAAGCA